MKKIYKLSLVIVTFLLIVGISTFFLGARPGVRTSTVIINDAVLKVEIVDDMYKRRSGLMWRLYMPKDQGMLFVCTEDLNVPFWMKNTFLPLSIAFVDEDMTILNIQKMKPLDTSKRYVSPAPYKYAIEVNRGWFEEKDIEVGDKIEVVGAGHAPPLQVEE